MKDEDVIGLISEISKLYKNGEISKEEYEASKERLRAFITPKTGTETRMKNITLKLYVVTKSNPLTSPVGTFIHLTDSEDKNLLECTGQSIEDLRDYPELYTLFSKLEINKLPNWKNYNHVEVIG